MSAIKIRLRETFVIQVTQSLALGCAVLLRHDTHSHPAAGRGGQEGRGQRGDGEPGAQREGRGLREHPGGGADRARRARVRAAHQAARRAGPAGRPGAAGAAEPDLPGVRRGGRRARWPSAASRPCCAPGPPAGVSEADYVDMLLDQQVSGVVFAGGLYAQADAARALPPAVRARPAGGAGQRGRRRPRLPAGVHRRRGRGGAGVRASARRSGTSGSGWCSARRTTCRRGASWPRSPTRTGGGPGRPVRRSSTRCSRSRAGRRPPRRLLDNGRHRHHLRQRRAGPRRDPRGPPGRACGARRRLGGRLRRLGVHELHRSAADHGPPADRGDGPGGGDAAGQPDRRRPPSGRGTALRAGAGGPRLDRRPRPCGSTCRPRTRAELSSCRP